MAQLSKHIRGVFEDLLGHVEAYPLRALFFFIWAGWSICQNFFIVTLRHEGFSGKEIAVLATTGPLLMFLTQPVWGVVADRFGRRRCLQIGTLAVAAAYFWMYWVHGFWPFFFTAAGVALCPPLTPLMDAVALDFVQTQRKLSYGMFRIWGAIAVGGGTFGAGYLIEGHATRTAFLWGAGALVAAAFLGGTGKSTARNQTVEKITVGGLGPVVRNARLMGFLAIVFFVAFSSTAFWNFNAVYYTDIGASSTLYGLAIAISSVAEIPLYFLAAPIFKRFGFDRALLFTFVCSTLRAFAYAFTSNPRVAIWIELTNGVSWTLFWVAAVEHVGQLVKPEWRATGQTLLNAACFGAGVILGTLWNGFLLDYFKFHFVNAWIPLPIQKVTLVSGLMLTAVTAVSVAVFRVSRRPAPPEARAVSSPYEEAA